MDQNSENKITDAKPDPAHYEYVVIRGKEVRVEFIHHATQQMSRRRIKVQEVLDVLRIPDQRGLPTDVGRERNRRANPDGSGAIDVVYEKLGDDCIRVITAFRTR